MVKTQTPPHHRSLKIAFFTDDYHPYMHGVISSIDRYRHALEALGHEVYVIAPKASDYDDHDDHVLRMPSVNSVVFEKRPVSLLYPGMERKLKDYDFDIVHSHTQFYMGVLAKMVASRKGIPHISTMHTIFTEMIDDYPFMIRAAFIAVSIGYPIALKAKPVLPFETVGREDLKKLGVGKETIKKQGWKLTNMFFNKVDVCISPSAHLMDKLLHHGLEAPHVVLPNGIEIKNYGTRHPELLPIAKARGEKWIVSTARLSGEKRPEVLIRAMEHVTDKRCKLILISEGPQRDYLEDLVDSLDLRDVVYFAGKQSYEAVAAILAEADMFALASYHFDNQPMAILEAIASGLPVVYCDEQLTEGLTTGNAVLTDGIEAQDFADVFNDLLSHPAKARTLGEQSKIVAKEFDINRLAKKLEKIYLQQIAVIEEYGH